ncbi:MAG: glycine cleavage system protein T [Candidatus Roseilinea sp.]|nr:MAG: glycine cleavage system protein T [Candidatus Roseilinea sp.]
MLLFDLSEIFSRIRLRGSTRLDFLHRMSTGDVRGLRAGEGTPTVLTTPIGRMVDYLMALAFDDSVLLIGGEGNQDKVVRWLRKYIFFNDDVQVSDETGPTRMFGIGAEGDWRFVEKISPDTSLLALPAYAHRTVESPLSSDGRVTIVRAPQAIGLTFFLVGSGLDLAPHLEKSPLTPDFEAWRILQGYPRFPNEINEEYIPLEAGLWGAVSFNKGCYTGQEIIARMESRGQIAKKLVWLTSSADSLSPGEELLTENGEVVGKVTSATRGAALAYVRSAFAQESLRLYSRQGAIVHVARIVRI